MKLKYLALIMIGLAGLGLQQAKADLATSQLTVGPNGTSGNFGTVTVNLNVATQTATITFTSNSPTFFFIDNNAVAVQVNSSSFTFALVSDASFNSFHSGQTVNGFGSFNLEIRNNDGWADRVSSISFTVTNTSGTLWTSATQVLAFNTSGFDAAAHVATQGGSLTFFVAENTPFTHVPDGGATVMLLGAALSVLGVFRRRLIN